MMITREALEVARRHHACRLEVRSHQGLVTIKPSFPDVEGPVKPWDEPDQRFTIHTDEWSGEYRFQPTCPIWVTHPEGQMVQVLDPKVADQGSFILTRINRGQPLPTVSFGFHAMTEIHRVLLG